MKTRILIHCSTPVAKPSRRAHLGSRKNHRLIGSAMAGLTLMVVSGSLHAQAVSLGAAENFTIVTSQGLTNNGLTVITGNVALSPLTTISGFDFSTPPGGGRVIGTVHYNDGLAAQAQADSLTAYNTLAGKAYLPANNLTGQDLGGKTLTPGVYHFNTSVGLTGNMILNTQADPNAVFIFQIGSTLTAAVGSSITVIGAGAGTAPNIFWQVGSSATLNAGTAFTGNILAQASVSLGTGSSLANGRLIALDGAVTLLSNSITAPGLPPVPPEGGVGRFWNGSASKLWSGTNWSSSAAGLDQVTLGESSDVVFSINSGAVRQNTILDSDTTISSLTFNDSAAVTIGGTNVLTLSATGLTSGIKVNDSAGLVTIKSGLVLGNRSQFISVNNEAGMLISGVIAGSNPLTKTGSGLLTLTGRETYTGATVVTGGTLQIGNGMTAGSSIASSSSVLINNSGKLTSVLAINLKTGETFRNSVTDNGQIRWIAAGTNTQSSSSIFSGTGNMRITAPGNTVLLGSNSFSGGTSINTNANVLVGTSTAFGSGVLNIKNARVDTYKSALLDINVGGYVQSSGEIRMHLQGTTAGSYTRYNVAGTAKLSGGKVFVYDASGNYVPQGGDKQNILHTTGGLNGKFASDSPYSKFYNADLDRNLFYHRGDTLLYPTITYKAKDAYIKWVQGSFANGNLDLTHNQTSVARSLDGYTRQHPGDPDGVVTYLNQQNISDLPDLYDLIAPDELTAIFQMGFSAAEIQNTNIKRHLEQVRHEPVTASPVQYTPSEKGSKGGMVEQTAMAPETHRWSVFLEGTGGSADVGSTYNADGYEFDTMGMSLGADLRVNDHLVVGILGSYANSDVSLVNGGSIEADNYKAAVYATAFANGFHVDALLGAGYNTYDTKRSSLLGYANGSPDAWELDTLLNVGYDFHVDNWTFSPNASVAYTQMNLNHFRETGSMTPLQYPDQDQSSLRSELGLSISYTAMLGAIKVTPQVRISWQHEFLDSTQSMDSRFASGNGPLFTVDGPQMDRDRTLIGAGVNVQITPTVAVYGYYDGQLGSSNYSSNTVSAGVKIDF